MKRVLMKCETYTMLIAALQIRRQYFKPEDKVELIVTDESRNSEKIAGRIAEVNEFSKVYFVRTKKKYKKGNLLKKIRKIFYVYEPRKKAERLMKINDWKYDDFFFCNYDIPAHQIFRYLKKANNEVKCHRFEEGYSTYTIKNVYGILSLFVSITSFLLREKNLESETEDAFFYEPTFVMYPTSYPLKKIPPVRNHDKDLINKLNWIFEYKNEAEDYQYPYILFEESFSVDKKNKIDDYSFLENIIKIVGKDNVIIKIHPRNNKNRFENLGVKVGNSNLPWEIIFLNGKFDNTVFLTISSGSVLNSLTWNERKSNIVLLYKCLPIKPRLCDDNYEKYVQNLISISAGSHFYIPKTTENFKSILEKNKYPLKQL